MKVFYLVLMMVLFGQTTLANEKEGAGFIANQKFNAKIKVGRKVVPVKGQISLNLSASPTDLKRGIVKVRDANLVFFGLDQVLLTGKKPKGKQKGVLGFSSAFDKRKPQILKYDPEKQTLIGSLRGQADFPQLAEFASERPQKGDLVHVPVQHSTFAVELQLEKPLPKRPGKKPQDLAGDVKVTLRTSALSQYGVKAHLIESSFKLKFKFFPIIRFEVARRLCLQPVRFQSFAGDANKTGAGLNFGKPGLIKEWNKADIVFTIRSWKTITNSSYKIASEGAEESSIRGTVQDDDCIEIFFVENFTPVSLHGGGATWGGGTASSQVITSDGNAVGGVDFTHLAHEVGHVLGLHHPGAGAPNATWPNLTDGSTGTLMCPSGWLNDNPDRNSQENKGNVSNPLLTFALKVRSAGPDCSNSADCGSCY